MTVFLPLALCCSLASSADAPLDTRTLARPAMRSMLGIARTGSVAENGSGDYVTATVESSEGRLSAIPVDEVIRVLREYGIGE
jgi:D-aminopeptidase